jgi:phosphopantetheinyl transferase (holo-ACP synthase)
LQLHGAAAAHAARLGVRRALVTITHSQTLAFAEVMLLSD